MINTKECKTCGRNFCSEEDFLKHSNRWRLCSRGNLWFNCECHSTLLLKKGDFDWYQPEQALSNEANNIFIKIRENKSLPYVKSIVFELEEIFSEEQFEIEKSISLLKRDPIIAAEILNTANRYKNANKDETEIQELKHSIVYLGPKKVKDIVISTILREVQLETQKFHANDFWEESFTQAITAEFLAKKFAPYLNPEEMYLSGFFATIGKLLLAYYYPNQCDKIITAYKSPRNTHSWLSLEKIHQVPSSIVLGEIATSFWGLPINVEEVFHKGIPSQQTSKMLSQKDFLVFSSLMSNWIQYNFVELNETHLSTICKRLHIKRSGLEEIAYELSDYIKRSKEFT